MPDTEVLIAGAGPTGLVLALRLARAGIRVRIIDKALEPGTTSRALVVHARTLELYRQMGLADLVVEEGTRFVAINLWVRSRHAGRVMLGDMGKGLSPFPYMIILPQDRHEVLLIERLRAEGVVVERGVELSDVSETTGGVHVRLKSSNGDEEVCHAAYLAGCDGARSRVREILGVGFPGGTYQHLFYVADVEARGPVLNQELHADLAETDFLAVFPLREPGNARLIGIVRDTARHSGSLTWETVAPTLAGRMGLVVDRVNWFSTYQVHHRVAGGFRRGRAFLLGDAGHIHSPVGGQGMNTGIGDAVNLAWKLADVLRGRAEPSLLETYEPERIAFARRLVATTDRGFVVATSSGRFAGFMRVRVVPLILPLVFRLRAVRRFMFKTVSQILIKYPDSPLSEGKAGSVRGGDRLPWFPDNFSVLDGLHWQVHVYGAASPGVVALAQARDLPLKVFPWEPAMGRAGFQRDAIYLVRPDGYVGFAGSGSDVTGLEAYLALGHSR